MTTLDGSKVRAAVGRAKTTHNGDALAERLSAAIGTTDEIRRTCALICRHASTLHRLAVEECNGPHWMDASDRNIGAVYQREGASEYHQRLVREHGEKLAAWETEANAREELTRARISWLVDFLPTVDGQHWSARLGGDPRGCVAGIVAPAGWESLHDSWGRDMVCVPFNRS